MTHTSKKYKTVTIKRNYFLNWQFIYFCSVWVPEIFLKKGQNCKASKLGGGRILTHGQSAQHLLNWIFIQVSSICNILNLIRRIYNVACSVFGSLWMPYSGLYSLPQSQFKYSTSVSIQIKGGKYNLGKGLTTHPDGNQTTQNFSSTTMYTFRCCILLNEPLLLYTWDQITIGSGYKLRPV
jgi:hypothetical protein